MVGRIAALVSMGQEADISKYFLPRPFGSLCDNSASGCRGRLQAGTSLGERL
jgi:hypothetical protein